MNVYDFDQTIFYPDSSACFVLYCLRHFPRAVLRAVPSSLITGIRCLRKEAETKDLKEKLFSFLPYIPDVEATVSAFWEEYRDHLEGWYLRQKQTDDLIVSASPEFLLRPVCDELGVRLIATPMNPYTGKIHGQNCHDKEKVRRFVREYPGEQMDDFYSDSFSDLPMAQLARRAYWVNKRQPQPWPEL